MTDKIEFYPTVDIDKDSLSDLLEEWQFDYNWHRPHSSLGGKTSPEKVCELLPQTPLREDVESNYDAVKERFQERHYKTEMLFRKLNDVRNPGTAYLERPRESRCFSATSGSIAFIPKLMSG